MRKAILVLFLLSSFFVVKTSQAANTDLLISEIMYDAQGADGQKEWLEVFNSDQEPVEILTGSGQHTWRFYDGSNHTLNLVQGTSTIPSLAYFIIAGDADQFIAGHPDFSGIVFDTVMSLPNSSSTLALSFDGGDTQNITASYDSAWGGAGDGYTLEKISLNQNSEVSNWQQSYVLGGTPGKINSQNPGPNNEGVDNNDGQETPAVVDEPVVTVNEEPSGQWSQIIISEFLPNPSGSDDGEWIELYNIGPQSVDLANFKLQDNSAKVFTLGLGGEANLNLAAKTYMVLYKSLTGISLNNTGGDSVKLYDPDGGLLEAVVYPGSAPENKSYARQNGSFSWSTSPTPGADNQVLANQAPQADILIKSKDFSAGQAIIFSAENSIDPEEGELKYIWDFGDDARGDEKTENHIFTAGGNYLVKLKVTDIGGLTDEASLVVNILEKMPEIKLEQVQAINFQPADFFISEFMSDPVGSDDEEWVEIYNASEQDINLAGWRLDDAEGGSRPYVFNASSTIAAGQFLLLYKNISRLSLNNQGDEVRLLTPLENLWQAVTYEKLPEGQSQAWDLINQEWFVSEQPSPGAANINLGSSLALANLADDQTADKQLVSLFGVALGPSSTSSKSLFVAELVDGSPDYEKIVEIYLSKKNWPDIKKGDLVSTQGQLNKQGDFLRVKVKQAADINLSGEKIDLAEPEAIEVADLDDIRISQYLSLHGVVTKKVGKNIYLATSVEDEPIARLSLNFSAKDLGIKKGTELMASGVLSKIDDNFKLSILQADDLSLSREVLGIKEEGLVTSTRNLVIDERTQSTKKTLGFIVAGLSLVVLVFWLKNKRRS